QAAEAGAEGARGEVEPADVRHIGHLGAWLIGPLVVGPPCQLGEALVLEDDGDRRRAERLAVVGQSPADVVDREVLLPQRDDLLAEPRLLTGRAALACRGGEEIPFGPVAELVDEDAEAPRGIPEPGGGLRRREA